MKILMVCLGNICRSPLAEGILKNKLPSHFVVDSAGTSAFHRGESPDSRAIQVAKNKGIDISIQRSRPFQVWDFEEFDKIYVMDKSNLQNVLQFTDNKEYRGKVSLILDVLENSEYSEVPDPYYSGQEGFELVYRLLDEACEKIANDLQKYN